MNNENERELLPCPFCGFHDPTEDEQGILILRPDYLTPRPLKIVHGYSRMCGMCGVRTPTCETLEQADTRWNTRQAAPEAPAEPLDRDALWEAAESFCYKSDIDDLTVKHIDLVADFAQTHVDLRTMFAFEAGQRAEREKYNELIMAVASKYPNETRHQTALRYIQQAESNKGDGIATASLETPLSGEEKPDEK